MRIISTLVFLACISGYTKSFRFYIYEWPERFYDAYPNESVPLVNGPKGHGVVNMYRKHEYRENNGFGKSILPEVGLYETFQFSLFKVIFTRLLRHPQRTLNRSEADAFFVPYDVGFNGIIDKETGRELSKVWSGCDQGYDAMRLLDTSLNTSLSSSLSSSRLYGHDHFLVFDLSNSHYLMDPCYFFLSHCVNCTVLGIETLLYATPYTKWLRTEPGIYPTYHMTKRWQGVPFPSSIHYTDNMLNSSLSLSLSPPWTVGKFHRHYLVVFWGNAKLYSHREAIHLRKTLISQCHAVDNSTCRTVGGNNDRNAYSPSDFLLYANSTFCLHPAGDAETRKGIFDSLLLGCIPVVFSPQVLHRVYGWHFSLEEARLVSVYLAKEEVVKNEVNVIEYLRNITAEEILMRQRAIERIAFSIQYSVPPSLPPSPGPVFSPSLSLSPSSSSASSVPHVWSPPHKDAVDVILDTLERKISYYKQHGEHPPEDSLDLKAFHQAIYMGEN